MQAIATARRLGAIVSATDVRPAAKEEIRSLGATFVGVEDEETAKQTGAYAGELSDAFRQKQAELMAATVAKNDIVICTALVMGRRAPVIVTAGDGGQPCGRAASSSISPPTPAATAPRPGRASSVVTPNGVRSCSAGTTGPAASRWRRARSMPATCSPSSRTFWDKDAKAPRLPDDDDIVKGVLLTRGGAVVHPQFAPPQSAGRLIPAADEGDAG